MGQPIYRERRQPGYRACVVCGHLGVMFKVILKGDRREVAERVFAGWRQHFKMCRGGVVCTNGLGDLASDGGVAGDGWRKTLVKNIR